MTPLLLVFAGVVTSVLLMALLRPLAVSLRLMDIPDGRKMHGQPVPIIGGLAMYGAVLVALLVSGTNGHLCLIAIIGSSLMVLVGVLDDRWSVPPIARILAQVAVAVWLVLGTGYQAGDWGDLLGFGTISLGTMGVPFTIVACIALINALNMLDGVDGIAGGVSLAAFAALGLVAAGAAAPVSAAISWALVGAILGFMAFNMPAPFNRRFRTFMGDAGSTLLGFLMAGVALVLVQPEKADLAPVVVLWFAAIPIFELFTTTARRLVARAAPWRPDRGHFHHRLLAANFSVRLIFGIYLATSVLLAVIGYAGHRAGTPDHILFAGFLASFGLWLAFIHVAQRLGARLPDRFRRASFEVSC